MNYRKFYFQLIRNAQSQNRHKISGIYEKHHIIPSSMNGGNDAKNLVLLTLREHFLAHYALTKFLKGKRKRSMIYAFNMLCNISPNKSYSRYNNSRLYEANRKKFILQQKQPRKYKHNIDMNKMHQLLISGYSLLQVAREFDVDTSVIKLRLSREEFVLPIKIDWLRVNLEQFLEYANNHPADKIIYKYNLTTHRYAKLKRKYNFLAPRHIKPKIKKIPKKRGPKKGSIVRGTRIYRIVNNKGENVGDFYGSKSVSDKLGVPEHRVGMSADKNSIFYPSERLSDINRLKNSSLFHLKNYKAIHIGTVI